MVAQPDIADVQLVLNISGDGLSKSVVNEIRLIKIYDTSKSPVMQNDNSLCSAILVSIVIAMNLSNTSMVSELEKKLIASSSGTLPMPNPTYAMLTYTRKSGVKPMLTDVDDMERSIRYLLKPDENGEIPEEISLNVILRNLDGTSSASVTTGPVVTTHGPFKKNCNKVPTTPPPAASPITVPSEPNEKVQVTPESCNEVKIVGRLEKDNGDGGCTIHKYLLGELLGKGGFASVYHCSSLNTSDTFAIKVVSKADLAKRGNAQKLQVDFNIQRSLQHNNVCKSVHYFEDEVNCYILLELCNNITLHDMNRQRNGLTEPEVKYYLKQLFDAVQYLHGNNVIHHNLTLDNLLLDGNLRLKVTGFGLAKCVCNRNPNYIAPEIISAMQCSFQVDIWSMGIICFTLLFGQPPFQSKDVVSTEQRILSHEYDIPGHIPISGHVRDLISALLQSNPKRRPTLDEIAAHAFFTHDAAKVPHCCPSKSSAAENVEQKGKSKHSVPSTAEKTGECTSMACDNAAPPAKANDGAASDNGDPKEKNALPTKRISHCISTIPKPPSPMRLADDDARKDLNLERKKKDNAGEHDADKQQQQRAPSGPSKNMTTPMNTLEESEETKGDSKEPLVDDAMLTPPNGAASPNPPSSSLPDNNDVSPSPPPGPTAVKKEAKKDTLNIDQCIPSAAKKTGAIKEGDIAAPPPKKNAKANNATASEPLKTRTNSKCLKQNDSSPSEQSKHHQSSKSYAEVVSAKKHVPSVAKKSGSDRSDDSAAHQAKKKSRSRSNDCENDAPKATNSPLNRVVGEIKKNVVGSKPLPRNAEKDHNSSPRKDNKRSVPSAAKGTNMDPAPNVDDKKDDNSSQRKDKERSESSAAKGTNMEPDDCLEMLREMGFSTDVIKAAAMEFRNKEESWNRDDIVACALKQGQSNSAASSKPPTSSLGDNDDVPPSPSPGPTTKNDALNIEQCIPSVTEKSGSGTGEAIAEPRTKKDARAVNSAASEPIKTRTTSKCLKQKDASPAMESGGSAPPSTPLETVTSPTSTNAQPTKEPSSDFVKARSEFWRQEREHRELYTNAMEEWGAAEYARQQTQEKRKKNKDINSFQRIYVPVEDIKTDQKFMNLLTKECEKAYKILYGHRIGGTVKIVDNTDGHLIGRFGKIVGRDDPPGTFKVELQLTKAEKMAMKVEQAVVKKKVEHAVVLPSDIELAQSEDSKARGNHKNKKGKSKKKTKKEGDNSGPPTEYIVRLPSSNFKASIITTTELDIMTSDRDGMRHALDSMMNRRNEEEEAKEVKKLEQRKWEIEREKEQEKEKRFLDYEEEIKMIKSTAREVRSRNGVQRKPLFERFGLQGFFDDVGDIGCNDANDRERRNRSMKRLRFLADALTDFYDAHDPDSPMQNMKMSEMVEELTALKDNGSPYTIITFIQEALKTVKINGKIFVVLGRCTPVASFDKDNRQFDYLKCEDERELEEHAKVLGVSPNASEQEIVKAYKKMARKYHPDKFKSPDGTTKTESEEMFKKASNAQEYMLSKITDEGS